MRSRLEVLAVLSIALCIQPVAVGAKTAKKCQTACGVTLFVSRTVANRTSLDHVRVRAERATPLGALQALASYRRNGDEEPPLPKDTRVLGVTVDRGGTATADFSREIVDNFPGGSRTEQILLGSIVDTLSQFRSIQRIVIRVEGQPVDSIGGHIELDEPLEREPTIAAMDPSRESPACR